MTGAHVAETDARQTPGRRIAVVLKGYPRLSETFIAQEILALQKAGFDLEIVSLRRPTDNAVHPIHRQITAPVTYLPEYLYQEPLRVARALRACARLQGFRKALRTFATDFLRDPTPNRGRRFGQACVLAAEIAPRIGWLHAHFIHTPASATRYASIMTGLPWTCSAHAKDIWTSPDWDLAGKLADTRWTVTCTASGHAHLASLSPVPDRVHLSYHGIDLDRFASPQRSADAPQRPVDILAVGRAVEKKGFDLLLTALAALPADCDWRLTHIGGGERLAALKAQACELGLAERIDWRGAQPQEAVLAAYRDSDIFALPCRIARNGDRDGLPNVLMEAQSQRLACVSTDVSGVSELIEHERTGLLCPPEDAAALAEALARLIRDPQLRRRLAMAGEEKVRTRFDHDRTSAELIGLFRQALSRQNTSGAA